MYGNRADLQSWPSISDEYNYYQQRKLVFTLGEAKEYLKKTTKERQPVITLMVKDATAGELFDWLREEKLEFNYPNVLFKENILTLRNSIQ